MVGSSKLKKTGKYLEKCTQQRRRNRIMRVSIKLIIGMSSGVMLGPLDPYLPLFDGLLIPTLN